MSYARRNRYAAGNICLTLLATFLFSIVLGSGALAAGPLNVDVLNKNNEWIHNPLDDAGADIRSSDTAGKQYTVKIKLDPITQTDFAPAWMQLKLGGKVYEKVYLNNLTPKHVSGNVYELVYTFTYGTPFPVSINYELLVWVNNEVYKSVYLDFEGPPPQPPEPPPGDSSGGGPVIRPEPVVITGEAVVPTLSVAAGIASGSVSGAPVREFLTRNPDVSTVVVAPVIPPGVSHARLTIDNSALTLLTGAGAAQARNLQVNLAAGFTIPGAILSQAAAGGGSLQVGVEERNVAELGFTPTGETGKPVSKIIHFTFNVVYGDGRVSNLAQFAAPMLLTMNVTDDGGQSQQNQGLANLNSYLMYRWEADRHEWTPLRTRVVDPASGTLGTYLSGNSTYAVLAYRKTLDDINGHWAQQDIELMAARRVVKGMTPDTYAPNQPITRAEFTALLLRSFYVPEKKPNLPTFWDNKKTGWYYGTLETAREYGLVAGYEDNSFRPDNLITREEMAAMVVRAVKAMGAGLATPENPEAVLARFQDAGQIAPWARAAAAAAVNSGIIRGRTATAFAPKEHATRAEAAVMLKRLLQAVGDIK